MNQGSSHRKPRQRGPAGTPERHNPPTETVSPLYSNTPALAGRGPKDVQQEVPQVLVVDDEVVVRRVLTDYLQGKGYTVAALESGETALQFLRRSAPNVILLDIFMPGVNGLEVLRTVRRECPETQVLIISGFADEELERKVKALGAIDCLRKPFDFSRLHTLVASCLHNDSK